MSAPIAPSGPDRPPRYINLGWWAFVAAVLVVLGGAFVILRSGGDADQALETTPGFEDGTRPIDTTPFELIEPSGVSTTLPDYLFGPTTSTTTTTTTPTTTTTMPPTTTTTLPPLPATHPDAVCRGFIDLIGLTRALQTAGDEDVTAEVASSLADLARRLEAIGEASYSGGVLALDDAAERMRSAASFEQAEGVFRELNADDRLAPVSQHAQSVCPEVLAAG